MRLLARLGLLSPNDVAEWVNALLAAQALSPYRSKARVEVADKAKDDPRARGQLGVLGALHAVRVWTSYAHMPATLPFANAETNERTLDTELIALIRAGRKGPRRALDESAWVAILERTVGATEAKGFDATIVRGGDVVPPSSALGPCFRLNPTRAKDVDVGLDLGATVDGRTRALARLERGGVANRAGAKDGDVLVNFSRDATGHVRLVVARGEGSTKRDTTIDYEAATISAKASGFTPLRGKPDAECGSVL